MRALIIGALALFLTGCGDLVQAQREAQANDAVQEAREAYETCMAIHNVDPERCASYKDIWQANVDAYNRLRATEKPNTANQGSP